MWSEPPFFILGENMSVRYNKKVISKLIVGSDGVERMYKARKLATYDSIKEGFKLLTALTPALGSGMDAMMEHQYREEQLLEPHSNMFGKMLNMLTVHISEDHFDDISRKMLGSLMVKDKEMSMEEIEDYFDDNQGDYLTVLCWLFVENFKDFLWGNATLRSLIEKLTALLTPKMKEVLDTMLNSVKDMSDDTSTK